MKKAEHAEVKGSCDETRHKCKCKCDVSSQGRVKRRDRGGKRAAGWKGEHRAAAQGLGEEATDETSEQHKPSSQITPPNPKTTCQAASKAAADAMNPNAMSAEPTGPVMVFLSLYHMRPDP
ncbi:hypothetical protein BU15DRAFT_71777 [Melanogaster broomeanus]|nr:hypothetical protein BU15DRAFT_71777 [Melanogaster broomeanus]